MTLFFIIICSIAVVASVLAAYRSMSWAPAIGWCALAVLMSVTEVTIPTIIFWGIAAAIAVAIGLMLPRVVADSRQGLPFMMTGALAGAFVGMLFPYSNAGMILGAVLGTAFGLIIYSRTSSGAILGFPSKKFFNYACAKGFPAVVTACICALAVLQIVQLIQSL